jgi:hypothetical protein
MSPMNDPWETRTIKRSIPVSVARYKPKGPNVGRSAVRSSIPTKPPNDPKGLGLYSPPAHQGEPDPEEGQGKQECGNPQDPEEISG